MCITTNLLKQIGIMLDHIISIISIPPWHVGCQLEGWCASSLVCTLLPWECVGVLSSLIWHCGFGLYIIITTNCALIIEPLYNALLWVFRLSWGCNHPLAVLVSYELISLPCLLLLCSIYTTYSFIVNSISFPAHLTTTHLLSFYSLSPKHVPAFITIPSFIHLL